MIIPLNFHPRDYQLKALAALERGVKLAVWCWSRRGGKDFTAFGYAVKKMVEQPMNVVLVFPTKEQGKNSFWENIENDGFKTIEHIPDFLIKRQDNSSMRIILKNGSTFQILGASDPDALRGANAKLYIFSEFVDIPTAALDVIRPVVAANGGQIIIQSTPKIDGISGGTFKILFDRAMKNPNQFASLITADRYIDAETLEELRLEAIERNGNDFFWKQEFMCDWGQASSTSYYGAAIQQNEQLGNIGLFGYDSNFPAYTAWDLGTADSTAITFFQNIQKTPRIIDYYETHDIGYGPIVNFLSMKPYNIEWHFIPHDGSVREQGDAQERLNDLSDSGLQSRLDKLNDKGLINASLLQRENVEDGIRQVVENLPTTQINEATTKDLMRKLLIYKRKFNGLTGDYLGPEHKTESHAADSLRYMFTALRQDFNRETGEFLYSPANQQRTYSGGRVQVAGQYRPR